MKTLTISIGLFLFVVSFLSAQNDSMASPWQEIELTGSHMKLITHTKAKKTFPWIPVGSAVIGGGVITYFLVQGGESNPPPTDCSHRASFNVSTTSCGLAEGAISVQISPAGAYTYLWSTGNTTAMIDLLPAGNYTVTVSDANDCSQVFMTTVAENTILTATDDTYSLSCGETLSGNLLANDEGNDIRISENTLPDKGMLTLEPTGDFTYTPMPADTGQVSFNYTITDPCNNTATGRVILQINPRSCDYTATFNATEADCGLANGSLEVIMSLPGNYEYIWSTGETTNNISGLAAGTYDVTVSDPGSCCSIVFTTTLTENPADYISDTVITQSTCSMNGEIQFEFASPGTGPWIMEVHAPHGITFHNINPGTILLSTFVPIIPGDYTLFVRDENTGPECSDSLRVTVLPPPLLTIELEGIRQPSSPSANDGIITIVVTSPTIEPYTLTVNDDVFGVFSGQVISIPGLSVGRYEIQLTDVNGCASNILEVELTAFVGIDWGVGTGFIPNLSQEREKGGIAFNSFTAASMIHANLTTKLGNLEQSWQLGLLTPVRSSVNEQSPPPILCLEQMTTLFQTGYKAISGSGRLGGLVYVNQVQTIAQWSLEGKMSGLLFSKLAVNIRVGIRGGKKMDSPYVEWSVHSRF